MIAHHPTQLLKVNEQATGPVCLRRATCARRAFALAVVALCGLHALSTVSAQEKEDAPAAEPAPPEQKPEPQAGDAQPANPVTNFFKGLFGNKPPPAQNGDVDAQTPPEEAEEASPGRDQVDGRAATSPRYVKNLRMAEIEIAEGRWHDGAALLQELIDLPEDSLWLRPDGRWASLRTEAEARIGALPPEGQRDYHTQFGPLAERMLTEGGGLGRIEVCLEVADRYLHTDAGYRSADAVAAAYFDRGEFALAGHWYARLWSARAKLTEHPDWRAKAAYAALQGGRQDLFQQISAALGDAAASAPLVAATRGRVRDWLTAQQPLGTAPPIPLVQWPMFGGNPTHTAVAAGGEPLLLPRWSQPLTSRFSVRTQIDDLLLDLADNDKAGIPASAPIVVNGQVAFRTLRGLAVADVETGQLLWETSEGVSAERLLLGESDDEADTAAQLRAARRIVTQYGVNQFDQHPLTKFLFRDGVYGLLSSDGTRLFAIEQHALMTQSNYGYWWGGMDPSAQDAYGRDWSSNQIVAFDLGSGRPLWEVGGRRMGEPFDPPLAGTYFFGPPVPDGGELFAIGERDNEVRLFVLAAQSGELLWSQPLANVSSKIEVDGERRLWECQPAVNAGMVVCPTTAGWLVAVDRQTHRILWTQRYAERPEQARRMGGISMNSMQSINVRWCPAAPLLVDGCVLVTPAEQPDETGHDQPRLICLDALTGDKLWEREKEESLYVAGVADGAALVVGRNFVRAHALADGGKVRWTRDIPTGDGPPSGRGVIVGNRFILPLQSGQLWVMDLATGNVAARMRAREREEPLGNLALHDGTLLSLGPRTLTGFEQRQSVERQIADRAARDPADLWAGVKQAEVHFVAGDFAAALQSLDQTRDSDDSELAERRRRLTFQSLTELARADLKGRDPEFTRAAMLAAGDAELIAVGRLDAERRHARGDFTGAFAAYWELSRHDPQTVIEDGDVALRLYVFLGGRLHDEWQAAPHDARGPLDAVVHEAIQAALSQDDEQQERVERLCDFHPAARPLIWALIDAAVARGDFAPAEVRLRRLAADIDRASAARAVLRLAELFLAHGQPADAARCFQQLEAFGDIQVSEWTAEREASEAFETGRADRTLLDPPSVGVWSGQEFDTIRMKTEFHQVYAQAPVIQTGSAEFFRRHRVEFDPQLRMLSIADAADGAPFWSVPLRGTQQNVYNESVAVMASGLQAVVAHQGVLHAVSLPDLRVLWTQTLPDRPSNVYLRHIYDPGIQALRPPGSFVSQAGLARSQQPTGMLGLVSPRLVAYYGRGEIVAVDPLTGELLWRRRGIPPQAGLYGDAETLYVVPRTGGVPFALRARDGRTLEIPGLADRIQHAVAVIPQGFVVVSDDRRSRTVGAPQGQLTVSAVRADSDQPLWSCEFDRRARLGLLDDHSLFVLTDAGACHTVDLATGVNQTLGDVPADLVKSSSQIHAVADGEFVYVLLDHLKRGEHPHINAPAVRINGSVCALRRDGTGLAWQREVPNQCLLLSQLPHAPVLVFLSYRSVPLPKLQSAYTKLELLALEKSSGHVVADLQQASNGGAFYALRFNLADRYFEVRSHNERIRVQARNGPAPQAAALP